MQAGRQYSMDVAVSYARPRLDVTPVLHSNKLDDRWHYQKKRKSSKEQLHWSIESAFYIGVMREHVDSVDPNY